MKECKNNNWCCEERWSIMDEGMGRGGDIEDWGKRARVRGGNEVIPPLFSLVDLVVLIVYYGVGESIVFCGGILFIIHFPVGEFIR